MQFPRKWRPSLGMITAAVIASALLLPLVGLLFFRLYENQLVRQTEGELIAQSAMLASACARVIDAKSDAFPVGPARPAHDPAIAEDERYAPIVPTLDLATSPILPVRPVARVAGASPSRQALDAGRQLTTLAADAQRTTLAGFRLLDASGTVIGGREETGASLAHVPEVQAAMAGRFRSVMRVRNEDVAPPPIYSISRGTQIRVFVAFPVFVANRVRGIVYASRTPDNILRNLYRERSKLIAAIAAIVVAASAIGLMFVRTIARPMAELATRAEEIRAGRSGAIGPLKRHGTREIASLTQSFMIMARRLSDRSDYLSGFANHVSHELKSPLTAIRGAAELMRDSESAMSSEQRERFLNNVLTDAERISVLLDRLRDMARADNPELGGESDLAESVRALSDRFDGLDVILEGAAEAKFAMSGENTQIVLGHLLDNSRHHGADRVVIAAQEQAGSLRIAVRDNGRGVSAGNRARIFDPFFTTRRAEGGTGMGLGIVRALLRAHGGDIALEESESGASFVLTVPAAQGLHKSS